MPVKSRSPLDTATKRLRLIPRGRPYLARIAKGKDLAYRRGPGSWSIHDNGKVKVFALADDHEPSNGKTILTFDEAMAMARKLLLPEDGAEASKLTTVSQALDLYAVDLQARKAAVYNARAPRVHLPPGLLSKPLALITDPAELKNWRNSLSKKGLASATVNRVCNCLRAALTLADKNRSHIWRSGLEKLPDGEVARNVVLTDDTVWAFVDACDQHDPGLGLFMDTLATTGARPSQAVRLKVHNFHDEDREPKLMMPPSAKGGGRNRSEKKHGKPYPVPITPALAVRLRLAVKGRPSHAPLLLRSNGVPRSPLMISASAVPIRTSSPEVPLMIDGPDGPTKHDKACPRTYTWRASNQIGEAVPVDVAGPAHGEAACEVRIAVQPEACVAVETRELQRGAEARGPEHDISRARIGAVLVCKARTDDEVVETIAVHVTGAAHRAPSLIVGSRTIDAEPVRAIECGDIEERGESPTSCRKPHSSRRRRMPCLDPWRGRRRSDRQCRRR